MDNIYIFWYLFGVDFVTNQKKILSSEGLYYYNYHFLENKIKDRVILENPNLSLFVPIFQGPTWFWGKLCLVKEIGSLLIASSKCV